MSKKQTKKKGRAAAMPLSQIIKKINKENAPPGGWRPEDSLKQQASSIKRASSLNSIEQQAASNLE